MRGCIFGIILSINIPKYYRGKDYVIDKKTSPVVRLPLSRTWSLLFHNTLIQERYNHSESFITVEVSPRTQKVGIYPANERSCIAIFSSDLVRFFGTNFGNDFGVMVIRNCLVKP